MQNSSTYCLRFFTGGLKAAWVIDGSADRLEKFHAN